MTGEGQTKMSYRQSLNMEFIEIRILKGKEGREGRERQRKRERKGEREEAGKVIPAHSEEQQEGETGSGQSFSLKETLASA